MIVFVVNCGSSSLKYQLLDMDDESVMAKGLVERIGMEDSLLIHTPGDRDKIKLPIKAENHNDALGAVLAALTDKEHGVIESIDAIDAVGHRVVHGGELFADSNLITNNVIRGIEACNELAPLHNPPNVLGIKACEAILGSNIPQVAVFDTAFHQTMPERAYLYGLPYEAYEKYGVRRYGFHGTSHKYVSQRVAEMMGEHMSDLRIITCHLGNGASLAAVKYGKCIDTTMGFTPLDGMVMGTRCGVIDPAIVSYLMSKMNLTPRELDDYLNKQSGILGISGVSSDFRDVMRAAGFGNRRAELAIEIFAYKCRKYIGSYAAAMGGVDALVFTAGLGENSPEMREKICEGLQFLGIRIDHNKNNTYGHEAEISMPRSAVEVFVVPTNEELMIARDTKRLCKHLIRHRN